MKTQQKASVVGMLVASAVTALGATAVQAGDDHDHGGRKSVGISINVGPSIPVGPRVRPLHPVAPVIPQVRPIPPVVRPSIPQMGFDGHIHHRRGMFIDSVRPGTPAARMGLERGDIITIINHTIIDCEEAYRSALNEAVQNHHGDIAMKVRDGRSGKIVARTGNLFWRPSPGFPRHHDHDHDHAHDDDRFEPRFSNRGPVLNGPAFPGPRSQVLAPASKSL